MALRQLKDQLSNHQRSSTLGAGLFGLTNKKKPGGEAGFGFWFFRGKTQFVHSLLRRHRMSSPHTCWKGLLIRSSSPTSPCRTLLLQKAKPSRHHCFHHWVPLPSPLLQVIPDSLLSTRKLKTCHAELTQTQPAGSTPSCRRPVNWEIHH